MKKIYFITVMIVLVFAALPSQAEENYRRRILECILAGKPYEYMFQNAYTKNEGTASQAPTINLYGTQFGEFLAGTQGALFYSGWMDCLNQVNRQGLKKGLAWGSLLPLEIKLGVPVAQKRKAAPFRAINPLAVKLAARIFVPDPKETLDGKTMQEIYEVVFRRGARLMTESYLYLTQKKQYEKEQLRYFQAWLQDPRFEGTSYLERTFAGALDAYSYRTAKYYGALQPEYAIGFWLRRGLDGSAEAIWKELSLVMEKYDGRWFRQTKKKYKKTR